jgi:hypothetical protein
MNKEEAKVILAKDIAKYRQRYYNDLLCLLESSNTFDIETSSGVKYQLEFQAVWDDKKDDSLRIIGSIDGRIRSLFPLTNDFILTPNGLFVGE